MSKEKEKYTVGELARKGGVSVRTLQYYDKIGLLAPNEYSEGGRRSYGRADILRLQQILFLKTMGFPLEEIRDKLLPKGAAADLGMMFRAQKSAIDEQIKQLQEAAGLLDSVINEIKSGNEIGIENLFTIMAAFRTGSPYAFMIRHFDREQMNFFLNRFDSEQAGMEFNRSLEKLTVRLLELYRRGADPAGDEAQLLAAEWWELVMTITKGDPEQIKKLFALAADEKHWPSDTKDLKEASEKLLGEALLIYFKNKGIDLPFVEGAQI